MIDPNLNTESVGYFENEYNPTGEKINKTK